MQVAHSPDRIAVRFDDDHAVADAGLIPAASLAEGLGLRALFDTHLELGAAPGAANAGDKAMTLIHSALAGDHRPGATHCETYGLHKQGASKVGRDGTRGYHPLLTSVAGSGDVRLSRLREGVANSGRGAASFLTETINRARRAGATGPITLHGDSGFYNHKVVNACYQQGVRCSISVRAVGPPWPGSPCGSQAVGPGPIGDAAGELPLPAMEGPLLEVGSEEC